MQTFVSAANRTYPGHALYKTSLSDFVTSDLSFLYPIMVVGPKDATPHGLVSGTLTAQFTGTNPDVDKLLSVLTFREVIGLLSQFTVTLAANSNPSYIVSGELPPGPGTPAKYGGTLDTIFSKLCLYDIGELLAQATFQVNDQGSYTISVATDDMVGGNFVTGPVGPRMLGYLTVGLNFMQFSATDGSASNGPPKIVTFLSNKGHAE